MATIAVFGCGGFLAQGGILPELASRAHTLRLFSTSRSHLSLATDHRAHVLPLTCPPHEMLEVDLIVNFCTEGVSHKSEYGALTVFRNVEITTSCVALASFSKGKKLLHIGSIHEGKISAYCDQVNACLQNITDTPVSRVDPYALSKSLQTMAIANLAMSHNISAKVVLSPNIYGPPNPPNSLGSHLDAVIRGDAVLSIENPTSIIQTMHLSHYNRTLMDAIESFLLSSTPGICSMVPVRGEVSTVAEFAYRYMKSAKPC